jgi:HlyD family secretion protein
MKYLIALILVVVVVGGGAAYYKVYVAAESITNFRTVEVVRDNLTSTISATGTVEPIELVDVGAQIAGRIVDLGPDTNDTAGKKKVDYCSYVHEGDLLALIDDLPYKAQRDQAHAAYLKAQADLQQMKAKLMQTENDRKRADELSNIKNIPGTDRPIKGIADSDYDLAVANHEMAKANVEVGKAAITQNKASLDLAERNLSYTVIKSPVDGQIVDRRVNIGQTVVSGLSAPSLFLIAKDMRRMQVWASVNEADIGQVRKNPAMGVRFTVDAYPGETFRGKVVQVRYNATSTQNIVVYTVVVEFDNPELKILPYMTASLLFEVEKHENILVVPTSALRWKPKLEQITPDLRKEFTSTLTSSPGSGAGQSSAKGKSDKPTQDSDDRGRLWIQDGNYIRPIYVQTGATDGTQTEVSSDDLKEGTKVVVGIMQNNEVADSGETNPFGPPKFPRGNRQQGQRQSR